MPFVTQAILPVAGLGTRFLPWTKAVPKEMLPIGTLPIIAHLVDECLGSSVREICFIISRGKEVIPQFFAQDAKLEEELRRRRKSHVLEELLRYDEASFTTVYQDEQLGDGHAVLQAEGWIRTETFAVLFGDDLIPGPPTGLQQLLSAYQGGVLVALEDVPRERVSHYGIVRTVPSDGRCKQLRDVVEKPTPDRAPSTLGIVGKYLLPRSIFSALWRAPPGHGGEVRLVDAFALQIAEGAPVSGLVVEGRRFDTGTPEGYREAVLALG